MFLKVYQAIAAAFAGIAALLIVAMTLIISAEALMRSLGMGAIVGVVDMTEYSLFMIALLAAPWILIQNGHIEVDLLVRVLRPLHARLIALLTEMIGMLLCATVAIFGVQVFLESFSRQEYIYSELIVPEWWLQWQIPAAFLLMTIEFARRLYKAVRADKRDTEHSVNGG